MCTRFTVEISYDLEAGGDAYQPHYPAIHTFQKKVSGSKP